MNFTAWDTAIASRLQPIRTALASIPVAALPKEAGKFGKEQFESIDWLFPEYSAASDNRSDTVQLVEFTLVIRLNFEKRYASNPEEKAALEWAEEQILSLLPGYRLPDTQSSIRLVSGRLFAPQKGQWYKELRFSFDSLLVPSDDLKPFPLVKLIGVDDRFSKLVEVSQ